MTIKKPDPIQTLIDQHHESIKEQPRPHMGASALGHACDRWLWLSFRWSVQPQFPGRILRLFRRGREEEPNIIKDLRSIGLKVREVNAQERVTFGSHVSGSLDAIIDSGMPGDEKSKYISEFKTHGQKSFDKVVKEGVKKAKFEHWVQTQIYMAGTGIHKAMYVAICKNTDEMYTEILEYDHDAAQKYIARGQRIALTDRMPEPLSTDPTWFECRFCSAHKFCHETKLTEHVNCRTCAHSTSLSDDTWHCKKWDDIIPFEAQLSGCDSHVLHPDLVPWKQSESPDDMTAAYEINGKIVFNGEFSDNVYSSKEILANPAACALEDDEIKELRRIFDAKVVG